MVMRCVKTKTATFAETSPRWVCLQAHEYVSIRIHVGVGLNHGTQNERLHTDQYYNAFMHLGMNLDAYVLGWA